MSCLCLYVSRSRCTSSISLTSQKLKASFRASESCLIVIPNLDRTQMSDEIMPRLLSCLTGAYVCFDLPNIVQHCLAELQALVYHRHPELYQFVLFLDIIGPYRAAL